MGRQAHRCARGFRGRVTRGDQPGGRGRHARHAKRGRLSAVLGVCGPPRNSDPQKLFLGPKKYLYRDSNYTTRLLKAIGSAESYGKYFLRISNPGTSNPGIVLEFRCSGPGLGLRAQVCRQRTRSDWLRFLSRFSHVLDHARRGPSARYPVCRRLYGLGLRWRLGLLPPTPLTTSSQFYTRP